MIVDGILRTLSKTNPPEAEQLAYTLKSAVIVKPQNVVDYYFNGTDQEYWNKEDFPNCAPPWQNFWMEWRMPTTCITNDLTEINEAKKREGAMKDVRIEELGHKKYRITWPVHLVENFGCMVSGAPIPEELKLSAKWLLTLRYFVENESVAYLGNSRMWVSKEGELVRDELLDEALFKVCNRDSDYIERRSERTKGMTAWGIVAIAPRIPKDLTIRLANYMETKIRNPAMLAISFCHCKNVVMKSEVIPPKVLKKRAKANKPAVTKFYTMQIQPMRKILHDAAEAGGSLQKALHICRGHFKDYRDGRGLFGKVQGLFWWEQTLRGSKEQGVVSKEYKLPKVDNETVE